MRPATKLVGISVPSVTLPEIAQMVSGTEAAARDGGYRVILAHDHDDRDRQVGLIREMLDLDVDGMLVYPDRSNVLRPEYVEVLRETVRRRKPVVLLDRYVPGVSVPAVLTDNVRGMYVATEHLILSGRRRFAVLSFGAGGGTSERDRMSGFRNAMQQFGLAPSPVLHAELGFEEDNAVSARRVVGQWVAGVVGGSLPFDAIVCFQDSMAYGAYLALREAGKAVPGDVALVGYDNFDREVYRFVGLELTSVAQPYAEIGRAAMDSLLKQVAAAGAGDAAREARHVLLAPRLVVRTSCGGGSPPA